MSVSSKKTMKTYRHIAYWVSHRQLVPGEIADKWSFTVTVAGNHGYVPRETFVSYRWFSTMEESAGAAELWAQEFIDAAMAHN